MANVITKTVIVSEADDIVHLVYAYDSKGTCYAYQILQGNLVSAAGVAQRVRGVEVENLPADLWFVYTGNPLSGEETKSERMTDHHGNVWELVTKGK